MKILFSLTYYSPYVSGLTLYVKRLAEYFAVKGNQVSVISFQHEKRLKTKETFHGVHVVRVKPLFKISKGFISIDWVLKSIQEVIRNDVILVNLPQFEAIFPACFGRLFGKRVIVIYHCEVDLPKGILNDVVELLLRMSHYVTLLCAHTVITYTQDFARFSNLLPFFKQKLQYIYPPIYEPKINKRVQKVIRKKIGKAEFIIGIAARLAAEKGIEYVFEAIPKIVDVIAWSEERATRQSRMGSPRSLRSLAMTRTLLKLVIAGPIEPFGEEAYKHKILQLVEKYKDYVVFLGTVKEEDMGSFYSLLDVLVLPSVNSTEAFGMVQVEAMMMGVPVVAADLPGVRIPIQMTGMGIIIPKRESKKLGEAIVEVLKNKKRYIKNKDMIEKEFDIHKTFAFYDDLLNYTTR